MKKQILFITVTLAVIVLFSCSKERIKTQQTDNSTENSVTNNTVNQKQGDASLGSLKNGLQGWFEFNGNLTDQTGKLANAVPTTNGADIYTVDRKGVENSAIKFTGRYGLDISGVPVWGTNLSIAAWIKYDSLPSDYNYFAKCLHCSPELSQVNNYFYGIITTPITSSVSNGPLDGHWHLLVATYDEVTLKFYVDGNYIGSSQNPFLGGPYAQGTTTTYKIGYCPLFNTVWYGSMDDLRFYTRTLSASDVMALYNL